MGSVVISFLMCGLLLMFCLPVTNWSSGDQGGINRGGGGGGGGVFLFLKE